MAERFEFSEGTSNKFWTINLEGSSYSVHFGKIGTAGQVQTKSFGSAAEAKVAYDKLIAEKTKKGYRRIGDTEIPADLEARPTSAGTKAAKAEMEQVKPAVSTAVAERPPAPNHKDNEPDETAENLRTIIQTSPAVKHQGPSVRQIKLDPIDWNWATWRPRNPLPKKQPRPFDIDKLRAELQQMPADLSQWQPTWDKKKLTICDWTRAEAEFWLFVATQSNKAGQFLDLHGDLSQDSIRKQKREKLAQLAVESKLGEPKPASYYAQLMNQQLNNYWSHMHTPFMLPFFATFTAIELAELMEGLSADVNRVLMICFREYKMPYMTDDEIQEVRAWLKPKLNPQNFDRQPAPYLMASAMGMHDEIRAIIEPAQPYTQAGVANMFQRVSLHHDVIFGLGSADELEHHWRRLKLKPLNAGHARGLVACLEERCVDIIREWVNSPHGDKDMARKAFPVLAAVEAPETAVEMLHLATKSKVQGLASAWLEKFPDWTVEKLLPEAKGRGDLAEHAREFLKDLHAKGYTEGLPAEMKQELERLCVAPEDKLELHTDATAPAWLKEVMAAMKAAKSPKLPPWADPRTLSAVVVDGRRLNPEQVEALLAGLQASTWANVHPIVSAFQTNLERRACERMIWDLFERWMRNDAPPKDKWALTSIGLLGGDECALKITPYVRAWPGASQHQRAVLGLECLRYIGTETALMQINGIAQKLQFKALKQRAMECIEEIARDKGLSREQLEDRIIPDCDLDENGSKIFDFGARQYKFVLSSELKPMVKDPDGKLKTDLPKPGAKDDAALAAQAVSDWKLMKQQIKEVAKIQAFRLEQSMIAGRRWSAEDFEHLMVKHPLMINLLRMLIWASYDDKNEVTKTFRVTEEQTYADENDRDMSIDGFKQIGIVHAAHLSDELKSKWGEILSDYEIVAPFQQLGRTVMTLTKEELQGHEIKRFDKKILKAVVIVGALEKNGWSRGEAADGGMFTEHYKYFQGADVTAYATYEGIGMQWIMDSPDQAIESCFFEPGKPTKEWYRDAKGAMPLDKVDPVVVSEVLRLLTALTSKAEE
jgi:predicted DNA-binding WGR domain protein